MDFLPLWKAQGFVLDPVYQRKRSINIIALPHTYAHTCMHSSELTRRVWLQTCTCTLRLAPSDLHSQTLALPRVTSLAVFLILNFFLFIDNFLGLDLPTFYNSSQVVKTRKNKLNYNVTCNRCLHSPQKKTRPANPWLQNSRI